MSKLDRLAKMTTVAADTGDIEAIRKFRPTDATTNPSLLLQAAQIEEYQDLVHDALRFGKQHGDTDSVVLSYAMDKLSVNFGKEILDIIPGRVSTEVDARLSFNAEASLEKARYLIGLYEKEGVSRDRILIKLATTWEGVQTARVLESEGIHCNMTLLFSLSQAVACAEAGATLISPFVGRILDWYKKHEGVDHYPGPEDPGVRSVTSIYAYFKHFGYKTVVMGASFRNVEEILELAGCDLLTIAPKFLDVLTSEDGDVARKLDPARFEREEIERIPCDESSFRWMLNEDPMATEKLAEGIRNFAKDQSKLEQRLHVLLSNS